ncbi:cellulase family glycosylhydrolase [Skermania piniformis]|uniref:Cellulase family glycosylhydrolase n=1 Tax=Skermania pinensis TaxID=39122 RepID=A0ABX8SFL9_9ACTN|nr:cellulase family glycosylhydrolase [Skermania piniformis]QXQ15225.1 cellulase family glycosylhydrolase [Skermania piniformis]
MVLFRFFAMLMITAMMLIGLAVAGSDRTRPTDPPPGPASPDRTFDARTIGVTAVTTLRAPDSVQRADFGHIARAGIGAVRISIEWPDVEPVPGYLNWSEPDRTVRHANAAGLTVLAVIGYAPTWAAIPAGRGEVHPGAADPARFAAFVGRAAQRYRTQIDAWEIWNEPNILPGWAPQPDPVHYAELLRYSYQAIKRVSPQATVLTGGTAPALDDGINVSPVRFLGELYAAGGQGTFDGIALHPYNAPQLLSAAPEAWASRAAIQEVSDLMAQYGDGDKLIWCTEFGASSTPGSTYGVSEQGQAVIIADGIDYFRSLPNGGPFFAFDYRDLDSTSSDPEQHFGLVRSDYTAKPALAAVLSRLIR